LGVLNYLQATRSFPPVCISRHDSPLSRGPRADPDKDASARNVRGANNHHGIGWIVQVLPYIEQRALGDKWDFTTNVWGNRQLAETEIGLLYCPSRRGAPRAEDLGMMVPEGLQGGGTDYGACTSAANSWHNGWFHEYVDGPVFWGEGGSEIGIFVPNVGCTAAEVRDGMSNTVMLGELQRVWMSDARARELGFNLAKTHGNWQNTVWAFRSVDGWATGGVGSAFALGHNPGADAMAAYNTAALNNGFFENPGSEHPEGCHLSMADGSVRFFGNFTDPLLLKCLGSRAGGEVANAPD